ncbi:MAG: NADH-quinone oxidoreductase subunit NuoE [bacterium]|nr:NADH-quinone oxidoreductase subunit NuoE [bacterium]
MLHKEQNLETVLSEYKKEQGSLIPVLQRAQAIDGYLSKPVMSRVAGELGLYESDVYGVATFYTQFRFAPLGENIVKVCHGTACHVSGAEEISDSLCNHLKVEEGETTADGKFTTERVVCLGCCSLAPVVMVNEETYGRLTSDKVKKVLDKY